MNLQYRETKTTFTSQLFYLPICSKCLYDIRYIEYLDRSQCVFFCIRIMSYVLTSCILHDFQMCFVCEFSAAVLDLTERGTLHSIHQT